MAKNSCEDPIGMSIHKKLLNLITSNTKIPKIANLD
jgi:hypothetical protein